MLYETVVHNVETRPAIAFRYADYAQIFQLWTDLLQQNVREAWSRKLLRFPYQNQI